MSTHVNPPNIKRMSSGKSLISEMDQRVNRMVKLIEEDADSFAKKAEMYFQKRPEMISLVEEFHRMYRTLAERYESGEIRKNSGPPFDLQSQSSGVSDIGSEPPSTMPSPDFRLRRSSTMPSPDTRHSRCRSGPRAAGFDFFLGSSGNASDYDSSSTLDYESGPDDFPIKNYFAMSGNDEENPAGESLDDSEAEVADPMNKYDEEFVRLQQEVRDKEDQIKSLQDEVSCLKKRLGKEKQEVTKLQDRVFMYRTSLLERDQEIKGLKEALSKADVSLSQENDRLRGEIRKVSKERMLLEDHTKELEVRCQNLEHEIRRVRKGRRENGAQMERLMAEVACRNRCLSELTKNVVVLQLEQDVLAAEKVDLDEEISSKDEMIDRMNEHVHQLHVEQTASAERSRKTVESLQSRVRELEKEVEKKQRIIVEGAEEKREAIRQLCFSLEHYRNGYHRLRQTVIGDKRSPGTMPSEL